MITGDFIQHIKAEAPGTRITITINHWGNFTLCSASVDASMVSGDIIQSWARWQQHPISLFQAEMEGSRTECEKLTLKRRWRWRWGRRPLQRSRVTSHTLFDFFWLISSRYLSFIFWSSCPWALLPVSLWDGALGLQTGCRSVSSEPQRGSRLHHPGGRSTDEKLIPAVCFASASNSQKVKSWTVETCREEELHSEAGRRQQEQLKQRHMFTLSLFCNHLHDGEVSSTTTSQPGRTLSSGLSLWGLSHLQPFQKLSCFSPFDFTAWKNVQNNKQNLTFYKKKKNCN